MLFKSKSSKIIFIALIIILFLIPVAVRNYQSSLIEHTPEETVIDIKKLDKIISLSKIDIDTAISELENLSNLSDYTDYKKDYVLAKLYTEKEEYDKASLLYEELMEKNYPLKERAIFHYANLKVKIDDDKTALKYFNRLIREFPYSKSVPQAKYYLAQALTRLKLKTDAINTFKSLNKEYSETQYGIASNYYLGEYEYYKQNYGEALDYWRKYLQESPDGRFSHDITELISKEKKIKLKQSDLTLLGDAFYYFKDYRSAAIYYQVAQDEKKYYELGYSLFRSGNGKEGIKYFKEYAKANPNTLQGRYALFYSALSLPERDRKSFWSKVGKEIPEMEYYTLYKEAMSESSPRRREKLLEELIARFPKTTFTLDAVWDLMWEDIKNKNYAKAQDLGNRYFELSRESEFKHSGTRAQVGFWLGKIAEFTGQNTVAITYYREVQTISPDNYYSYRAIGRLNELTNSNLKDPKWNLAYNYSNFNNFNWFVPSVMRLSSIKKYYGNTIAELIRLKQFDEAIDLIGKRRSPSKRVTAWLKALNGEHIESIDLSKTLIEDYNLPLNSPIFKLSYPAYFWTYVIKHCRNYPWVDPFLVCGIIRQESRFDPKAVSVSDARGLMQLIPPTAKTVARELNIELDSKLENLHNPEINTALGVKYIAGLLNEFNNPMHAVASYNAGPGAIKRWLNSNGTDDEDLFVEKIPYSETRDYVKRVFAGYWTYKQIYDLS